MAPPRKPRIFGTWDFKWPQGKEVRVAFQGLLEDWEHRLEYPPLTTLITQLHELARQWTVSGANISFSFFDGATPRILPPPKATSNGKLFARSNFATNTSPRADYDILVSFAPLPLWFIAPDGGHVQVTGQTTALGSYATRVDAGIPTMVLGPNTDFFGKGSAAQQYFDSAPYRHIALHELGHALGMAHGHQNPRYRNGDAFKRRGGFKTDAEIEVELKTLEASYKTRFSGAGPYKLKDEIEEEMRGVWPHEATEGRIPFSDWSDVSLGDESRLENVTVMAHPLWTNFLKNPVMQPATVHRVLPSFDKDFLREMYPPRA